MWSEYYKNIANRNIGLLNKEQQEELKGSCVAVCGVGGLGGVISEILARTGIESFKLLDNGKFEPTNLNRQIYSFNDTNDCYKIDVTEEYLKKINPDIKIVKELEITEENVDNFLEGVDVIALSIDSVLPVLILSRAARRLNIPLVEGWAVVFGNVRVFNDQTPSVEEMYKFPTIGREISSITEEEARKLMYQSVLSLETIDGLLEHYPESAFKRLQEKGEGTTLAPMVWMTCVMMALEVFKIILNWGKIALAPNYAVYDGINHQIRNQQNNIDE
ncbi:dinucleotide-utilizing enzymes [Candidatus Scalindua japonica]|uniref:Dinucleotide-utilizing enzymes n=1 Tax=Candidatus Scalindua japonica TaxID=1284222 RepID=A0A286U2E4_9BACT|nr:ThiF family adenylyltransferase [Candidatus Scalindua japonica]GAX62297.1 dinucleotide-utilizing enzymes [Candidatus Scalindua japonica]